MSDTSKNWFDIDRRGLAKLIERRGSGDGGSGISGKTALVFELVANALDADGVTKVEVVLEPEEGKPLATVLVRDDAPDGFADLTHAWTLFAESSRKAYAHKRGRFNLGEKLVLALCTEASIISTKGAVMFDARGRSSMKARRERGSEFQGIARITRAELAEIRKGLGRIIVPPGVTITVNGEALPTRIPLTSFEATLPTEIADAEGVLRRSVRKTIVHVYAPLPDAPPMLHELGMPVVETGDKWDISIEQKCVLNMDRDNVTPGYLRDVRTLVVNAMHEHLAPEDANATFVNEALADDAASPAAVQRALDLKYGEKRAIWDPSDPEANMNLVADGYTLIKGSQLTGDQWANVKKHDAEHTRPAGQIRPTKKALFGPGGKDTWVPRDKWTHAMRAVVAYSADVCRELTGSRVEVSDPLGHHRELGRVLRQPGPRVQPRAPGARLLRGVHPRQPGRDPVPCHRSPQPAAHPRAGARHARRSQPPRERVSRRTLQARRQAGAPRARPIRHCFAARSSSAMFTPKQLKSMSPRELKLARAKRATIIAKCTREAHQLKHEIERRLPREVHFRIEMDENSYPGICFEEVDSPTRRHPEGRRHRVHPRGPQKQTRYPQDLCADEIEAWMVRDGITHVVSESEDTETSPECLAGGRYTRARFIKWWRILEEDA